MNTNEPIPRTRDEIETAIRICIKSLHEDFNESEKAQFWRGQISALMWVMGEN